MIVKNEYVKIKNGKKEYTLKNYIYDNYLNLFSQFQYNYREVDGMNGGDLYRTGLSSCVIKFDTPLKDYKNANYSDFDIRISTTRIEVVGNESEVSTVYDYNSNTGAFEINNMIFPNKIDLSKFDSRKITAIGFVADNRPYYVLQRTLYACIDTSSYSMSFNASRGISISRKDVMSSNARCDGYKYPLHLAPVREAYSNEVGSELKSILYSVGFGNTRGRMAEEFIIGEDAEVRKIDDFSYGVIMKNPISVPLYPGTGLQPLDSLYPIQPDFRETIYPQQNRYTGNEAYPLKTGYNYIIFRYRLYYYDFNQEKNINLSQYYTMSYVYNPKGIFTITNKIERG